jgi:hypothetical protein
VEIQQSTGDLTWYWNTCALEGNKRIDEDGAKQKAAEYLKHAMPQEASLVALESIQKSSGDQAYKLIYTAKSGGVVFGHVTVTIDIDSGEITVVNNDFDGTLPADIPKFDETKLKASLMKEYDVTLAYYTPPLPPGTFLSPVRISEEPVKPVLVYNLERKPSYYNYFLDAENAVWINELTGKAMAEDQIESGK